MGKLVFFINDQNFFGLSLKVSLTAVFMKSLWADLIWNWASCLSRLYLSNSVVVDFLSIVIPIVGVCNCSMFCCMLLYVHSSIAIILVGKRELIALLNLSSWCLVMVERLFLAVPRGCLQFVIVVFPDHTHLLFLIIEWLPHWVHRNKRTVFEVSCKMCQVLLDTIDVCIFPHIDLSHCWL